MTRRGHSLIELLAVMTASMTLLGITVGLLHRALQMQSATRYKLEIERSSLALARQFRADVETAEAIFTERGGRDAPDLIRLQIPGAGEVAYRAGPAALHRYQSHSSPIGPRHEAYRMPSEMVWAATRQGQLIQLTGHRQPRPDSRGHDIEVLARTRLSPLAFNRREAE